MPGDGVNSNVYTEIGTGTIKRIAEGVANPFGAPVIDRSVVGHILPASSAGEQWTGMIVMCQPNRLTPLASHEMQAIWALMTNAGITKKGMCERVVSGFGES